MAEIDLLSIDNGLVVAPAGCGKTHLIVEALKASKSEKPVLVLTHTNAGVAALRQRLSKEDLKSKNYRLATIDGWALRVINTFPLRSGYTAGFNAKRLNYPLIRKSMWKLLKADHITDILKASYSQILVDEYQDCSYNQHGILFFAAKHIPTCILGDELQAIFDFGDDGLADWEKHVNTHFPLVAELNTPWRWKNAGNEELGRWLLDARKALLEKSGVDLSNAPSCVHWTELNGDKNDHDKLVEAARCRHKATGETSLVIGDSRSAASRYKIAKRVPGIVTVEPVDLKDLTKYASSLDLSDGYSLKETLEFAESLITNVGAKGVLSRLKSLKAGTAKKEASEFEQLLLMVDADLTFEGLAQVISACSAQSGSRTYRPGVLRAAIRALNIVQTETDVSFEEAAIRIREENRGIGRQLPKSAIGSTLLLKGLEADHAIVLNASDLNARNLYVAMTRGAKSLTICSRTKLLKPTN